MLRRGQTTLEYILLIGVVLMVLLYMGTDIKRGYQSVIKVTADQIGNQANSDQDFNSGSYMINSGSSSDAKQVHTMIDKKGTTTALVNDFIKSGEETITNMGKIQ